MRILCTFIGGLGHFEPLTPIAQAAVAAGHDVIVACSGGLTQRVEARGFHALATSASRPAAASTRDMTPLSRVDTRAAEVEFAENFANKGARRHASAIQERIREWRPDIIVRDEADLGSAIAAEVLGIPAATVLVLAAGMLIRPDLVSIPLAALRAEHGLPPDPDLAMLTQDLTLSPFPPSFRSPDSPVPLPGTTLAFRSDVPARTKLRASRKRVYVTLGTVFNSGSGDLFERLLAGLADVDADVLVTLGGGIDPAAFGVQQGHVRIESFVPQAEVLASADLVVSHGGSGSLLAALTNGLPSVLLPLGADQPHNAARAEKLGLARVLDASTATPDKIRDTVNLALLDTAALDRAGLVRDEIAALPSAQEMIPVLETLDNSA